MAANLLFRTKANSSHALRGSCCIFFPVRREWIQRKQKSAHVLLSSPWNGDPCFRDGSAHGASNILCWRRLRLRMYRTWAHGKKASGSRESKVKQMFSRLISPTRRSATPSSGSRPPCAAAWRETRPITARIWPFLIPYRVLVFSGNEALIRERCLRIPCSQLTVR